MERTSTTGALHALIAVALGVFTLRMMGPNFAEGGRTEWKGWLLPFTPWIIVAVSIVAFRRADRVRRDELRASDHPLARMAFISSTMTMIAAAIWGVTELVELH